eukprot:282617-Hanusia_phi.AAC.2
MLDAMSKKPDNEESENFSDDDVISPSPSPSPLLLSLLPLLPVDFLPTPGHCDRRARVKSARERVSCSQEAAARRRRKAT